MNILILHLSDLHFKSGTTLAKLPVKSTAAAILELPPVDRVVIVITGDIAFSGQKDEYIIASSFLDQLSREIISIGVAENNVKIVVAPGNHDVNQNKCEKCCNKNTNNTLRISNELSQELDKMSDFFAFAKQYCEYDDSLLYYDGIIDFGDYSIQVLILNTAPYSESNTKFKENHYLPEEVIRNIRRDEKSDLHITLMHHSWEWFETRQRYELEGKILSVSDIVFNGHDHSQTMAQIKSSEWKYIISSRGGILNYQELGANGNFSSVLYNTDTGKVVFSNHEWSDRGGIFIKSQNEEMVMYPKTCGLIPRKTFCDDLEKDTAGVSEKFLDYFVFPRISYVGDGVNLPKEGDAECEDIFEALRDKGIVCLSGQKESGKSTLNKYLFLESIKRGLSPLLIHNKQFSNNQIEKLVQLEFEDQYGRDDVLWHEYLQLSKERKIILIDDFESIKSENARTAFLNYLVENVGMIVITCRNAPELNIAESVERYLKGEGITGFKIEPMLKNRRNDFIEKVCKTTGINSSEDIEIINNMIDYVVRHQPGMLPSFPRYLIECVKYFINDKTNTQKGEKAFGVIFETNIRNALISINATDAQIHLTLLEEIAYSMYFELNPRSETIKYSTAIDLVKKYNKEYLVEVDGGQFFDEVHKSGVMTFENGKREISFNNINTYAYFVAKKISRNLEKNLDDYKDVDYIMKNICFGINEQIVLFLSYVRSNTKMSEKFLSEAMEILDPYEELNLDANNIQIFEKTKKQDISEPSHIEKQEHVRRIEEEEKKNQKKIIEYKSKLEYDETEAELPGIRILRALKCIEIVAKSLIGQFSILEAHDKKRITEQLFVLPNKLIYAWLKPFDERLEQLADEIQKNVFNESGENPVTTDQILDLLGRAAHILMLNIYDDISSNCADHNTIKVLRGFDCKTINHKVQALTMEDRNGNTDDLINMAVKVFDSTKKPHIKMDVKQIVKHHMYHKTKIRRNLEDRIYTKFFPTVTKGKRFMTQPKDF